MNDLSPGFGEVVRMDEELEDFYENRGLSRRIGGGDTPALVVIDFIKAFTDPDYDLGSDLDGPVNRTAELLDTFREQERPRFFTSITYQEDHSDAGVFIEKAPALADLVAGDEAVEVDSRLQPRRGERVIVKKYASAFFGTDLSSVLVNRGVDTLVLAGCTTSGCIRATAVDGMQHGYRVLVPRECVGDRAEVPHRANLFDIDAKYGDVMSLQEVQSYLGDLDSG